MKAVQLTQYGSPEVLEYLTVPDLTPAAGEVLIRVESASVNYADIARRANIPYPFPTPLPFIPGSEAAGTIEAVGDGVNGLAVGTPVFALVGTGSNAYAQYVVTAATQVIPIPSGVSYDEAAALPVAGTTALLILREMAALQPGESVLIQGAAGGVGSYAVQLARLMGAGLIIGATSSPDKFSAAMAHGAHHVVDYTQPGWTEQVGKLTDGRGVDVVLEMHGGHTFGSSLRVLAPFGRLVVYGIASREPLRFSDEHIHHFFYNPALNQSILVFNLGLWFGLRPAGAGKAMGDIIGYVASGQVKVPVNHRFPLSQAAEAHRLIEARRTTGKVILKPWAEA
ncbi:MAG: NADPH:quinone oxidoreductase family protein [bacterium]|nr:NADPH:quinone oxidoreductase family protein [bacterium]